MADTALQSSTSYNEIRSGYQVQELRFVSNEVQEFVFSFEGTRDFLLASERALLPIWMTPEEDEAWKDL
jgi:hypothetical protein